MSAGLGTFTGRPARRHPVLSLVCFDNAQAESIVTAPQP
jgi:hypothetical protein